MLMPNGLWNFCRRRAEHFVMFKLHSNQRTKREEKKHRGFESLRSPRFVRIDLGSYNTLSEKQTIRRPYTVTFSTFKLALSISDASNAWPQKCPYLVPWPSSPTRRLSVNIETGRSGKAPRFPGKRVSDDARPSCECRCRRLRAHPAVKFSDRRS